MHKITFETQFAIGEEGYCPFVWVMLAPGVYEYRVMPVSVDGISACFDAEGAYNIEYQFDYQSCTIDTFFKTREEAQAVLDAYLRTVKTPKIKYGDVIRMLCVTHGEEFMSKGVVCKVTPTSFGIIWLNPKAKPDVHEFALERLLEDDVTILDAKTAKHYYDHPLIGPYYTDEVNRLLKFFNII